MEQKNRYATKKKGKTEVCPFWSMKDMKNVIDWFEEKEDWDGWLISMLELLLGRRIGDTLNLRWSDFYFENGKQKTEMTTLEEQKTGKTTTIPLTSIVFEAIDKYCENKNIDPILNLTEWIFNFSSKTLWRNRENNPVYKENNIEAWCKHFHKDLSDSRKKKIIMDFQKQNIYTTLGEYLYYVVEYNDVMKWQADNYRKRLKAAVDHYGIEQAVSTHTWRKSFGHWIYVIHQFDPNCLLTLQKLFSHATVQQTEDYIGLTFERTRKYMEDHGEFVKNVLEGKGDEIIKNSPVVSLKSDDLHDVLKEIIEKSYRREISEIDIYNYALKQINNVAVL